MNNIILQYTNGAYVISLYFNDVYQDELTFNNLYEALEAKLAWAHFLKV